MDEIHPWQPLTNEEVVGEARILREKRERGEARVFESTGFFLIFLTQLSFNDVNYDILILIWYQRL